MHEWDGEEGGWEDHGYDRSIITASSTLCVRWEGVDGEVRVCEGVRV